MLSPKTHSVGPPAKIFTTISEAGKTGSPSLLYGPTCFKKLFSRPVVPNAGDPTKWCGCWTGGILKSSFIFVIK